MTRSHTSRYSAAVPVQVIDSTARAAAGLIDASRSRDGALPRNARHDGASFGSTKPDTPLLTSFSTLALGTLTTGRAHAMYSGIFSVENVICRSRNALLR